ncbi:hypothetical protein Lal_00016675 [Lupinus albus]|uniref:Putative encoded peptide n=1 Tax=Lupinus albus TaxID=3870 RepID=A0A6A4QLY2_LUPAL|nr:putative encoded peptide [Lupinus albus]KAF1872377.1 hypothetical protein Lal_00016675 [Lupinus albus]
MSKFQAMHKYVAVFFVLFAYHDSLLTHGRKIKALNTDTTLKSLKTNVNVPNPTTSGTSILSNNRETSFGDTDAFRPTTPGSSPGVGHRNFAGKQEDMKAMVVVQSPDVKVYVSEKSKNDISPATLGHSHGVGHSHQYKNGNLN